MADSAGKKEEPRKIDFAIKIVGRNGKPMFNSAVDRWWENGLTQAQKIKIYEDTTGEEYDAEDTEVVTVGEMASTALLGNFDDKADGGQKRKAYTLWRKVDKAETNKTPIELGDKQQDRILELISKFASNLVYGQCYEAIKGPGEEDDDA